MLTIADTPFSSRLFVGTGKFSSSRLMREAIEASGRPHSIAVTLPPLSSVFFQLERRE